MVKIKCPYCDREPKDIAEYQQGAEVEEITPEQFVASEEGTFSAKHKLFTCTTCYINIGMPLNHELFQAYETYEKLQKN